MLTSSEQNTDISLAKNIKDSIATPLTHIFKQSLLTCVFPNQLKMAKGHSHLKKEKKKTPWCFFCFCVDFHCVFSFIPYKDFAGHKTQKMCLPGPAIPIENLKVSPTQDCKSYIVFFLFYSTLVACMYLFHFLPHPSGILPFQMKALKLLWASDGGARTMHLIMWLNVWRRRKL